MFYSHQLLARKAPLGQIWMAATLHAKINRRKLDKLDIIKICEEILNPSVPMALRLSGILMGGVVIVYERKVKILYDDVTRFLAEINEAWKVKAAPDPTVLPKGKSQAKKEAVTLPEKDPRDVGDLETQFINFSHITSPLRFQQTAYFAMRLDRVEEPYINDKAMEDDPSQRLHQAEPENITIFESFDMYQTNIDTFNMFERFDIEGDEETQVNFTSGDQTQILETFRPSPPPQDEYRGGPPNCAEALDQHLEGNVVQQATEREELQQSQTKKEALKRKTKITTACRMDCEQTIIPGHTYQSWLQNVSDLSRKGRKRKRASALSSSKITTLMDRPIVVLGCDLFRDSSRNVNYPAPLLTLHLHMKSIQHPHDLPSARNHAPLLPEPPLSERVNLPDHMDFHFDDNDNRFGSQLFGLSLEKQRLEVGNDGVEAEILVNELGPNFMNDNLGLAENNPMLTPGNSGNGTRSIPSSASEHHFFSNISDVNSARSNKKRPNSSSKRSSAGLEPVSEENSWHQYHPDPNLKLTSLSENDQLPLDLDPDLLIETVHTQTQPPFNYHVDKITDSIRMQMKAHFDTPGVPTAESLNHLTAGMNRKGAALLFYQTCVLASSDFLKVDQKVPFGDILISKGTKM